MDFVVAFGGSDPRAADPVSPAWLHVIPPHQAKTANERIEHETIFNCIWMRSTRFGGDMRVRGR
jgi:hypothetical protein